VIRTISPVLGSHGPRGAESCLGDNTAMAHDEGQSPKRRGRTRRIAGSGYRKILIALDFSEASKQALEEGLELARLHGAKLLLCTALTHTVVADMDRQEGGEAVVAEDDLERAEARLHAQAKAVGLAVEEYETRVLRHDPGNEIPKLAESSGCDLIIVANRGHSPKRRFFLGSVAERILRNSRTTVLVSKGI
jgi:nucleotide-binding universal stress UspA family protein